MKKKLILIRGVSGSGKTTKAKNLIKEFEAKGVTVNWFEADMFFEDFDTGEYMFIPKLLPQAHKWCQESVKDSISSGEADAIIVSNTFTQLWEIKPYVAIANACGFDVEFIEMKGRYKNVHNVPEEVVEKQAARFEKIPDNYL